MAFTFDSNNNLNVALVGSTPVVSENLASVGGANITLGAKTSANSLPVVLASDEATLPVSIAGTVAENLTQVGGASVTLGAKTSANSIPVVLATDEANVPVVGASSGSQSATWTSANGAATQIVVPCAGYATVTVNILSNGGTFNAGQLEFLAVNVNGTFSDITGMRQKLLTTQLYDASNLHTLAANERWNYTFNVSGFINFYIYILTPISGTGSVTVTATPVAISSPGPTTVGQSDASKLNVTNQAPVTTNPPVYTTGTTNPLSLDVNGGLRTVGTVTPVSSATWTSATAAGTHVDINCAGMGSVVAIISTTGGTFSTGQIRFFAESSGGFGFDTVGMRMRTQGGVFTQQYDADHTLTLPTNDAYSYWFPVSGFTVIRVYLNTAITGSGQVSISLQAAPSTITGPTTVGQADPTKLNATTIGAVSSALTATWTSSSSPTLVIPCAGYNSVVVTIVTNGGTFTGPPVIGFAALLNGVAFFYPGMRVGPSSVQAYDASTSLTLRTSETWGYWFNVAGLDTLELFLEGGGTIGGTGTATLVGKAMVGASLGPTTVGQSDPTKLNMTKATVASSFTVGAPAAATDFTTTVSQAGIFQAMRFRLVASGNTGNRNIQLVITDASGNGLYSIQPFTQIATQTIDYYLGVALPFQAAATNGIVLLPIPPIVVMPNWQLKSTTVLQAGDQWSGITYSLQTS